ncbi:MAG: exo-alpha-sialidase [Planctomycetes bacterium]|nr:exo-alpha-sialidase [Planctomycetota bacterium]
MNSCVFRAAILCVLPGCWLLFSATALGAAPDVPPPPVETDVYVSRDGGVHTYRIPAMIVSPGGALLVFCEARKESIRDASPTDMVLKRSTDGGATWSPAQVLIRGEGTEAIMNPCPVVDSSTGTILLVSVNAHKIEQGRHRHLLVTSSDDGKTWSSPVDLSERITPYDDTFICGPGGGIQTRTGRLIVPGYTGKFDSETRTGLYSRVLYSDDGGKSWALGSKVSAYTSEC